MKKSSPLNPPTPTTPTTPPSPPQPDSIRQQFINELLDGERKRPRQIKTGLHNSEMYFGTALPLANKTVEAVVTSDRQVYVNNAYNEIDVHFGLYYRYPFEWTVLDSHWSVKESLWSIKAWVNDRAPTVVLKELIDDIVKVNKDFMDYPDDTTHYHIALDVVGSYLLPCFAAYGRTYMEAERGSGKSKQTQILRNLCFNAHMSSDISKAAFYRMLESTVGTLLIDDFDEVPEELQKDIIRHYRTGYKPGGRASRAAPDDKGKRGFDTFSNYGHVVINNIGGLDATSMDRSNVLPLLKSNSPVTNTEVDDKLLVWQEIRDKCFCFALQEWSTVTRAARKYKSETLRGRELEIIKPLLVLANLYSPEMHDQMHKYFIGIRERSQIDFSSDWLFIILDEIWSFKEGREFQTAEVAALTMTSEPHERDYKKEFRGRCVWVGKQLSKLGFLDKKIINGTSRYHVSDSGLFEKFLRAKGWFAHLSQGGDSGDVGEGGEETCLCKHGNMSGECLLCLPLDDVAVAEGTK